ncbi:sensor histidine kinase [Halorussus lipolyticus]|uniref:sensor histidine kinase n=1 Tax=Halorussus lipolyticus TaxID=3034024 RepID=UPI0023E7CD7A|nr:HAMP domain-containing sensor histidine kinase [Halorussus sp. DT80]
MTAERGPSRRAVAEWIPSLVSVLGAVLLAVYLAEQRFLYWPLDLTSRGFLVGFFVAMVFIAPVLGGGYWLARTDLPTKRYPRIGKWILGGSAFFLSINLPVMAVMTFDDFAFRVSWGRWATSIGAAGGLLVGYIEARAIQRELQAQRAAIRAEEAENQRQWFDYLNGLLRHEVLNTANVIVGYASLVLEDDDIDPATQTQLETIHRQGENMTKVIRDVQVLIETTSDIAHLEPVDLSSALDSELSQLRDTYDSVTVEATIPDGVTVRADELLPRIFSNLLRNAVEHNDGDPEVRVNVDEGDDTATVRVADNGPGIPDGERSTLFERGDNTGAKHGLGLYLVRTLVERYGGSAELTETGPEGSVFAVELPLSETPPEVGPGERPEVDGQRVSSPRDDSGRGDAPRADSPRGDTPRADGGHSTGSTK